MFWDAKNIFEDNENIFNFVCIDFSLFLGFPSKKIKNLFEGENF
jgi:hypothetical protein